MTYRRTSKRAPPHQRARVQATPRGLPLFSMGLFVLGLTAVVVAWVAWVLRERWYLALVGGPLLILASIVHPLLVRRRRRLKELAHRRFPVLVSTEAFESRLAKLRAKAPLLVTDALAERILAVHRELEGGDSLEENVPGADASADGAWFKVAKLTNGKTSLVFRAEKALIEALETE